MFGLFERRAACWVRLYPNLSLPLGAAREAFAKLLLEGETCRSRERKLIRVGSMVR